MDDDVFVNREQLVAFLRHRDPKELAIYGNQPLPTRTRVLLPTSYFLLPKELAIYGNTPDLPTTHTLRRPLTLGLWWQVRASAIGASEEAIVPRSPQL